MRIIFRFNGPDVRAERSWLLSPKFVLIHYLFCSVKKISQPTPGLGVVFSALEDAKNILKKSIKSETVKVVDYKYGPDAAVVAGTAADAFGNIVDTADSAMGIGLSKKTFAKKLVKKTGKEMAKEACKVDYYYCKLW